MKFTHLILLSTVFHAACGSQVKPSSDVVLQKFSMNEELAGEVTKMRGDIEKAAADLAATNIDASKIEIMIDALDEQKALTDSTLLPDLDAELKNKANLAKELGVLRAQLAASTNPNEQSSLQSQIDQGDVAEDQLVQKIDEIRVEVDAARKEEERSAQAIVDKINTFQVTYNTTLTVLNTSRTQHVKTLKSLQETKDSNSKLGEISQSLLALNSRLQSDLVDAQDRIVILKQQLAELQGRYEDLKLNSAEAAERLDQVNGQLGSARAEVDELQMQVNRLAAERDKALAAHKEAERKLAVAEAARQQLARENADLRRALANERAANAAAGL